MSQKRSAAEAVRSRGGLVSLGAVLLVLSLALAACGDDEGGSANTAEGCPEGTSADGQVCLADSDSEAEQLLGIIEGKLTEDDLRAVVLGVQRGDQVLALGAVGDATTGVPATREDHYTVGNISAGFLTTALLLLVEDGKLALDDPLSNWFPDLPKAERITVEMLASSTSGYPHFPDNPDFVKKLYADPFRAWTADQLIPYGTDDGTEFPPGKSWLFADTNLVILGQILEEIEGKSLGKIIEQRILDPLELDETESRLNPELRDPALHGFTTERGVYEDATNWNPTWNIHSGSMASTLDDLMRWAPALGTGELLTPESYDVMTAPSTVGKGPMTEDLYYTFGIGVSEGWIITNPSLQGYTQILAYLPDEELTVVLAATKNRGADPDTHFATEIFLALAEQLSPQAIPPFSP